MLCCVVTCCVPLPGVHLQVKVMHSNKLTEKDQLEAKNEVRVLAALSHVNIVRYYECYAGVNTDQ